MDRDVSKKVSLYIIVLTSCLYLSCASAENRADTVTRQTEIQKENVLIEKLFGSADYRRQNTEYVSDVLEGRRTAASAAWWGFDPDDATDVLQQAIRSGARYLVIPNMGSPWNSDTLYLESDQEIIVEDGTVIMAKEGSFLGRSDRLIRIHDKENITLRGYGARIEMRKRDYQKPPYEKSSHRHALGISGAKNIRIYGLTISDSGGDGIYIRDGETRRYSENLHIKDVSLYNHLRQGISVISARNLLIENTRMIGTRGHPPQAGIDFEPNRPTDHLVNCIVRRCEIVENAGAGVLVSLHSQSAESNPISISVESSVIRRNFIFSAWVSELQKEPKGRIFFGNNDMGPFRYIARSHDLQVDFSDSLPPTSLPLAESGGPYYLEANQNLQLDGSESKETDEYGFILDYVWDLDGDGRYDDAKGSNPVVPWQLLTEELHLSLGKNHEISLRVMDDDHEWSKPSVSILHLSEKTN